MKRTFSIPVEEEWGNYRADWDQQYAHDMFGGRSMEAVVPHFEEGPIDSIDKLRFIEAIPFRYYLLALRNYLLSAQVLGQTTAPDAASGFLNLIEEKLQSSPETIEPVMDTVMPAVEYIAANQALFDADPAVYGSFEEKRERIRALYLQIL